MSAADTVWHYVLPSKNLEGWAEIFITPRGVFSAVSDYGSYGYVWTHPGDQGIRAFLAKERVDDCYLLSKLAPRQSYDGDETESALRVYLAEQGWDVDRIDELINEHELENELGFARMTEDLDVCSLDSHDLYGCIRTSHDPQAVAFVEKVMPRLAAVLRAELGMEERRAG